MIVVLLFVCFVCLAGLWLAVVDIRQELRDLTRDYERHGRKGAR